jgi:pimeloyl-ACP methyl ester carboxylesterase
MGRLSILIAPGASVLPEGYQLVTDALKARGYDGEALPIPSVGVPGNLPKTPPTMYDDAAFIASRVTELADNGKDVILIGHSYGGTPITECVKGLAKTDRERQGLKGGIIGLAYMAALIPEMGHPAGSVQAHLPAENKVPVECDVRFLSNPPPISV